MTRRNGTISGIAVALVAAFASAQALGHFSGSSPSAVAPSPFPFVLLAWTPITPYGVPVLVALFVALWCGPLFKGSGYVPARTVVLAWIVGLSSAAWFVSAAIRRLSSAGPLYTTVVVGASLLLAATTFILIRRARREPGISASALAHGSLFVWLVSYAFPWFGEVP